MCGTEAASSQKYKRIFLGAASGALNVSVFINPQLFLSSPRKKKKKTQSPYILVWKYPALTIVMFNFSSPALSVCCPAPHAASVSCCVGLTMSLFRVCLFNGLIMKPALLLLCCQVPYRCLVFLLLSNQAQLQLPAVFLGQV